MGKVSSKFAEQLQAATAVLGEYEEDVNFEEGDDDDYDERIHRAVRKTSVEELIEKSQQRFLLPKRVGTGSAGCGHLVRALRGHHRSMGVAEAGDYAAQSKKRGPFERKQEPTMTSLRFLALNGCGLETRHIKLLEKAVDRVVACREAQVGAQPSDEKEEGDEAAGPSVILDTRLNVREGPALVVKKSKGKRKRKPRRKDWIDVESDSSAESNDGDEGDFESGD